MTKKNFNKIKTKNDITTFVIFLNTIGMNELQNNKNILLAEEFPPEHRIKVSIPDFPINFECIFNCDEDIETAFKDIIELFNIYVQNNQTPIVQFYDFTLAEEAEAEKEADTDYIFYVNTLNKYCIIKKQEETEVLKAYKNGDWEKLDELWQKDNS